MRRFVQQYVGLNAQVNKVNEDDAGTTGFRQPFRIRTGSTPNGGCSFAAGKIDWMVTASFEGVTRSVGVLCRRPSFPLKTEAILRQPVP